MNTKADDGHLKRTACSIFTMLPEDRREALEVLGLVRQLVFCLGEDWETVSRSAPILPFSRKDRAGSPITLRAVPNAPQDKSSPE
ncbi:hypothetical protein EN828_10320 [Mesorhizobium sp. M2D.F.Ca.ET.185.01.1.1]|nr:hypothetical protein EN849_09820 [Mesorhizobium sp. M2D.F.Ca.ET.206.01.1.1]TGS32596.1 hypothetical protein EN828_10320 [Mesorhizobium sp. M2D.F.Ca.ET.185.01.1.1]TGU23686.1 hypothetical protein EN796_009870 [Mesorhizobium sp. M2D.F.Ca.ET.153.01.1.1]TGV74476.1 hypothetical protein EN792_058385 [Mesorhizobium sp. M00.F.Ca.ET.149.01.1.1]